MTYFRVSGTLASFLHCSVQKEQGLFLCSQKAKHLHSCYIVGSTCTKGNKRSCTVLKEEPKFSYQVNICAPNRILSLIYSNAVHSMQYTSCVVYCIVHQYSIHWACQVFILLHSIFVFCFLLSLCSKLNIHYYLFLVSTLTSSSVQKRTRIISLF